jgi:hypothetical protein
MLYIFSILLGVGLLLFIPLSYAANHLPAITKPIPVSQLTGFSTYPPRVQKLIAQAKYLSDMKITYLYGSANPKNKGMDCSGTIYYLLSQMNLSDVPRASHTMYTWVKQKGKFHSVNSRNFNSRQFAKMKPGDLLFWSGTYAVNRYPPITHVMLYLGKNKRGEPLMFGASDGRTYQWKRMRGVSVFDFQLPDGRGPQKFEGYSCIPDLTC